MKDYIMNKCLFLSTLLLSINIANYAMAEENKLLLKPEIAQPTQGLLQLIDNRKSERSFDKNKSIDDATLSEILWVAAGVNQYGRRTIATARNEQNIKIYILQKDGVWFYDATENMLKKISDENAIPYTAEQQKYVIDAPLHLIYTSSDKKWGKFHVGSSSQNVYLYATHKGLSTVVRGLVNFEALHQALKLNDDENVIAHQPIGYSK